MDEYKGIYYGDEKEQQFYEGGAHFKYIKLYKILEKIAKERNQREREKELLRIRKLKNSSRIMNKKNQIKTRNIISHLDINKVGFNTISNNSNKKNLMFNYKFMISLHKNRNKTKSKSKSKNKSKNFSLSNYKKDIDSRNKCYSKDMKGRPNTILKKMLFPRNHRLLSSSMEQKKKSKIRFPIKIKRSLPEFSSLKPKRFRNYSNNKNPVVNNYTKINIHTNSNKLKDEGNKSVSIHMNFKNYKAEDDRSEIKNNHNLSNLKYRKEDEKSDNANIFIYNNTTNEQSNISDSNGNKFSTKTNGQNLPEEEKNEKKEIENYTDAKNIKKNPDYFYNKLNYTNSIEISKKTHKIINKKYNVNKKPQIGIRTKSLKNDEINDNDSGVLSRSKIDKEKLNTFNKSSKKKKYKANIKKDFYIHNHTFIIKSNFNNQFYRILKDFNKKQIEEKSLLNKKLNNKKKVDKNIYSKIYNNQLSFNKFSSKSRNYNANNTTFQAKNTFNHNNIHNKSKNYYKIFMDINKTFNYNGFYRKINLNKSGNKSKSKSSNRNNSKLSNNQNKKYKFTFRQHKKVYPNNNEFLRAQYIIKPYAHLKPNNEFRNKVNLKSIKLNKKHNEYIQELSNDNNGIHKYI